MKKRPPWFMALPAGVPLAQLSLEDLRTAKRGYQDLASPVATLGQAYEWLLTYAEACVRDDRYPALTRCWKDLERRFLRESIFEDGLFVRGWTIMDFRFGPGGETLLDYFERDCGKTSHVAWFVREARRSRLGLYQQVLRSESSARLRDILTGEVASVTPPPLAPGRCEIILGRLMRESGQRCFFGRPLPFPGDRKTRNMFDVLARGLGAEGPEEFMRVSGPYWMSVLAGSDVLADDHYRTYLEG